MSKLLFLLFQLATLLAKPGNNVFKTAAMALTEFLCFLWRSPLVLHVEDEKHEKKNQEQSNFKIGEEKNRVS